MSHPSDLIGRFLDQNQFELEGDEPQFVLMQCLNGAWFSNVLAWLLDNDAEHGYGVTFAQAFLEKIGRIRSGNVEYMRRETLLKWGKEGRGSGSTGFSLKNASAVREYVYLTLFGLPPANYDEADEQEHLYWVRLSWATDILDILEQLEVQSEHPQVTKLKALLRWLHELSRQDEVIQETMEALRYELLLQAANCLFVELNRLGEGKRGAWRLDKSAAQKVIIRHSSYPTKALHVELLPTLSITVQDRSHGRASIDKIIVPYGARPDQIFNLLDIAARDICHLFFEGQVDLYLADRRRRRNRSAEQKAAEPLFEFVYKHANALKAMFALSSVVREAAKFE
ncbi:MAG: hypothetical protein KDE51_13000, partial [Anaerolineales bacterium]|nr:hypothetical protein [Anaerolineales bacterium]